MITDVTLETSIILGIVSLIYYLLVGRKENKEKLSETDGFTIGIYGTIIIVTAAVITFLNVGFSNIQLVKFLLMFFLTIFVGFHAYLDWKYLHESKNYIHQLSGLTIMLIYLNYAI
ncbi:DUF4181 domain-containing protein [Alkalibacillus aidingensis]|uniref:DUF4181 domain-containing protein n=1 Tax=Alkalibacillus aidingensis TaxID=2747607 RepID=UPI00166144C5|nr:DUF4181 domain-containing protein [Alkalibacillus aidingensis]